MCFQGIIQPKNDSGYHFEKFGAQIQLFFSCLFYQKQLQMKVLIKNDIIYILNSVLKEHST